MKPPTEDALRYAATVLGRDVTQLERLLDAANSPTGEGREQLSKLLAHVRSVRTWILGMQIPRAQTREAKQPRGPVLGERKPCTECGELMAYDHSVCFYCATGTRPNNERCETWIRDSGDETPHGPDCRCTECGAAPIMPSDLKFLRTGMKLVNMVSCTHPNAKPSALVPAFTCPDCGALFREGAR